jgi:hypothetical protein
MQKSRDWFENVREARPRQIEPGPVPSIGAMLQSSSSPKWCWAYCERINCGHSSPIAFATFAIRWGMAASTDLIRERLKCSKCGKKGGVALKHPSWGGLQQGWAPWPARPR